MATKKFNIPLSASHKGTGEKFFKAPPMTIDEMMENSSITVNITCDDLSGETAILKFGPKYVPKNGQEKEPIQPEWNNSKTHVKAPLWYNDKNDFYSGGNLNLRRIGELIPDKQVTIMLFKNNYENPNAPAWSIAFYPPSDKFKKSTPDQGQNQSEQF